MKHWTRYINNWTISLKLRIVVYILLKLAGRNAY
jgi:hypothetical protein